MNKSLLILYLLVCLPIEILAKTLSWHSSPLCHKLEKLEMSDMSLFEKITGNVTDKKGIPIPYAIIAELTDTHSDNIVQCDSTGYFEITVNIHSTSLVVSAIGYLPRELTPVEFRGKEVLSVALDENPDYVIQEVEVLAKRKTVVTTPTGLIYNMDDNPLRNNDVFESLKFVPMVTIQNNLISVVGRSSPVIYVNNRKLNLSGESLVAYLKTLPAKDVETVEIVRTPEAKYKGANSVLLIKLKAREDEGTKGFLNGQVWKTHNLKETGSITLDYAKNKWNNVFSIFAGNYRNYKEIEEETHYLKENYTIDRVGLEKSKAHTYQMNFMGVYQFSGTKSLGISAFGSLKDEFGGPNDLTHYQNNDQLISSFSDNTRKEKNITANLNYQYHAEDGDRYLIVDVDYLYNTNRQDVINEMNYVNLQGDILSFYLKERQKVPQNSSIYSAKVEYGGKWNGGFTYDIGADAYYSAIRTDNEYWGWENDDFTLDPDRSSDFDINEFTPTLFFDLSKKWNKVSTSLGARFEYTRYEGKEYRQNTSFKTDFFRALPQLNVHYQIEQKHAVAYSASYSLQRPSFNLLNPFIVRISPTEYSKGNPYLQSSKIFFEEINYRFNNRHSFYLSHQFTDDMQNII